MKQESPEKLFLDCSGSTMGNPKRVYVSLIRSSGLTRTVSLAGEPDDCIALVLGPTDMESFAGKSGFRILCDFGYTVESIEWEAFAKTHFRLVAFHRQAGMKPATWNNVVALVRHHFPEIAHMVAAAEIELKSTSFDDWQRAAGFNLMLVDAAGEKDGRFMTASRLLDSKGDALCVRRFLYHVVRLTEHFSGDGYVHRCDGARGLRQYVMKNQIIASLGEHVTRDVSVYFPNAQ